MVLSERCCHSVSPIAWGFLCEGMGGGLGGAYSPIFDKHLIDSKVT